MHLENNDFMRRKNVTESDEAELLAFRHELRSPPSKANRSHVRFVESTTDIPWQFYPPVAAMCAALYWAAEEYGLTGFTLTSSVVAATLTFGYQRCKPFQQIVDQAVDSAANQLRLKAVP